MSCSCSTLASAGYQTKLSVLWLAAVLVTACCSVAGHARAQSMAGVQVPPTTAPSVTVLAAVTSTPTVAVRLSRAEYTIKVDPRTGAPIMPNNIVAYARLDGWPSDVPQPTAYTWHVFLDWDAKPYPTHHSIANAKVERPSPFSVNLGDEVRGGRLKVIAKTTFAGREIFGQAFADVRGENPPRSVVLRAFPQNRIGLIASKIAMAESGMHQFNAVDGSPMVSRTNDLGLMQLNVPTGSVTSADQVWDWRANLRRGLEMLDDKRRTTVLASRGSVNRQPGLHDVVAGYENAACLNFLRWYLGVRVVPPPVVPPLSTSPGSGMLPNEADPDHLALSQLERDAIRRYNGGREYALAIVTDPATLAIKGLEWQVDPSRGGISAGRGDPNYVAHVLGARSGFVIAAPKAARTAKHRHSRRRHRR